MKRVLIIDDDAAVTNFFLVMLTQTERFDSVIVNDSREVPGLLAHEHFDVILLDMDMPEISGVDILELLRKEHIGTPAVVLTGVGDGDLAVRAMKLGAFDYLTKPVEEEHLLEVIEAALEHGALHRSLTELPADLRQEDLLHRPVFEGFVTQDSRLIRVLHEAEKMAAGDMTVFIIGERGTGREALAHAIHRISPRADGPFVGTDAAAHARDAFPSVFFGQARIWRGSTEERIGFLEGAAGGTVFVDNVEHLDLPAQLRLKRVVQTGSFYRENSTRVLRADVRFVVGSTQDLVSREYKGTFSQDLLYHLRVNALRIPPLRERRSDIPVIAADELARAAASATKPVSGFTPEAMDLLIAYPFPDNDEELRSIGAGAVARAEGELITPADLPDCVREGQGGALDESRPGFGPRKLADVEREHVVRMLQFCGGDESKAAVELGITVGEMERILNNGG